MPPNHRVQITLLETTFEATSAIIAGRSIKINGNNRELDWNIFAELQQAQQEIPGNIIVPISIQISDYHTGKLKFDHQLKLKLTGAVFCRDNVTHWLDGTRFHMSSTDSANYWELNFTRAEPLPEWPEPQQLISHC